jgi:TrmH family RNA methyltransferase
MVSKSQIKLIRSLHQKKQRHAERLFIAEGFKVITEFLQSRFKLVQLYVTEDIFSEVQSIHRVLISASELEKISALTTPSNCLAVFEIPSDSQPRFAGLVVALDDIRDPGNLGTIIRLCDWFGIHEIICSEETADIYNPKVVQASMGSLARVHVHYVNLEQVLSATSLKLFGTFMDGNNIYELDLPQEGIVVFGNEANGISDNISALIKNKITIPRFGDIQKTESLNVATATAIILSEFRRSASVNGM